MRDGREQGSAMGLRQAPAAHEAVTLRVGSELETMQRGETQTALHLREGETIQCPVGYRRRRR